MYDIEKAFADLNVENVAFEKAKKGEKKVGNPRYRKTMRDGKTIYVLVNKEEHPSQDKKINEENFDRLQGNGRIDRHYDEPPEIRDVKQLRHIDWIPADKVAVIERSLKRAAFYDKSVAFAQATGNEKIVQAHLTNQAHEFKTIDTIVERAFAGKNFDGFDDNTADSLREMGVDVSGISEDSLDFINNVMTGFDPVALATGMLDSIERQKDKMEKIGIERNEWNPKISMKFGSGGLTVNMDAEQKTVTDTAGYKCNLGTKMTRRFTGSANHKNVDHSYFILGKTGTTSDNEQNPLRQGFAKDVMKNFNKQYEDAGIDSISVSAASSGFGGAPYCGSNTWGRWGFAIPKTSAQSLINAAKSQFSSPKKMMVDEFMVKHKNRDDVAKYKKNENGAVSKTSFKTGTETVEGRTIETKVITKEGANGDFFSKVRTFKTIGPSDVEDMQYTLDEYYRIEGDDGANKPFRMKTWYDEMDNSVMRGLLQDHGWSGTVNLNDKGNKKDFNSNLNKRYIAVTPEDIKKFEQKND